MGLYNVPFCGFLLGLDPAPKKMPHYKHSLPGNIAQSVYKYTDYHL